MAEKKTKKPTKTKIVSRTPKTPKKSVEKVDTPKTPIVKEVVTPAVVDNSAKKTKFKKPFTFGTGRRKTGVASVFLNEGKGEFTINGKDITVYFPSVKDQISWTLPFHLVGISHPTSKYNATIKVSGSGKSGQIQAVIHGIAKALAKLSEENQVILRKAGLMTRDPRMVERKKPFLRKARKQPQYSKR